MAFTVKKSLGLAAAAFALGVLVLPVGNAEAQRRGGGFRPGPSVGMPAGRPGRGVVVRRRGGGGRGAALAAGAVGAAILGGALLARPSYAAPAYGAPVYADEPDCHFVRRRVWDEYRGRWVRVRERVCD